jgi:hypothetical protein
MDGKREIMSEAIESSGSESTIEGSQVEGEEVSTEEGSEQVEEQQLTPAQVKKIKKLKLKFNGKEIEEDLPFEIDEAHQDWYVKQRQKAMLADHKSREYAQLEQEVGAFIQELRKNPRKALQNPAIGLDVKELAASILQEEIERSQKTPEQIRAEEAEARLQELMEERENEKKELEQKQLEMLTEREYERYDNLMSSALESSDLPKSPYVVKKMTEYMIMAVENGIDVDPKDVIPLIRDEIHSDVQQMFGSMPAEIIEQIIGKETLGKLKSRRVAAAKPPVPVKSAAKDVGVKTESKKEAAKKQTMRDFFGV